MGSRLPSKGVGIFLLEQGPGARHTVFSAEPATTSGIPAIALPPNQHLPSRAEAAGGLLRNRAPGSPTTARIMRRAREEAREV